MFPRSGYLSHPVLAVPVEMKAARVRSRSQEARGNEWKLANLLTSLGVVIIGVKSVFSMFRPWMMEEAKRKYTQVPKYVRAMEERSGLSSLGTKISCDLGQILCPPANSGSSLVMCELEPRPHRAVVRFKWSRVYETQLDAWPVAFGRFWLPVIWHLPWKESPNYDTPHMPSLPCWMVLRTWALYLPMKIYLQRGPMN